MFLVVDACEGLGPLVGVIKFVVTKIVQLGIPIMLIIFGTIDLGKAVIASDDKKIKEAQSMLIKRFIYAAAVFFVVMFVQFVMNIVSKGQEDQKTSTSWYECWKNV